VDSGFVSMRRRDFDGDMSAHELLNHGRPFLYREHAALGLRKSEFKDAVRSGEIVKLLDRVYVDAHADESREQRIAAASLIVPAHAVISDETAAWIWGVDAYRPSDRDRLDPSWVVPHGSSRTRLTGVACRQALMPDEDIVQVGGIAITTPVRTVSDLLRKQWRPYALASADSMARAGLVRPVEVREYVARLKGYRGIRQARVLSQLIEPKSESPGESWTRLRLIDAGFPRPRAQVELDDVAGQTRFLDLAYVRRKVAVEYDGRMFHTAAEDELDDSERRRLISAVGYRFVIVRREQIFGDDNAFEREVGELLGMSPIARWW
jgi:hypothetical protein